LSPLADPAEKGSARGLFKKLSQESNSKHGAVFRGTIPASQLDKLAASPGVLWIEPAPKVKLNDEVSSKIVAGDGGPNITFTAGNFYDGSGVTVSVADSGLHLGEADLMHPDLYGRAVAFFYYGQLEDASDEHSHGTHVTGIIGGNGATGELDEEGYLYGLGVAPNVNVIAQRIFDGEGNYEPPPSFETLTRDAVRAGAEIGSNSWGDDTQGQYDISASEFDALVRDADELTDGDQQYILEFSAGNAGPGTQTIGSPAVAKNVIATGASESSRGGFFIYDDGMETMADFSSRGPCEDGRIKPDVVAPGTWIASLRSPIGNDDFAWGPISDYYLYQGGTSQAGPHVSGAAAVLVQYIREVYGIPHPSPALVKAVLINTTTDMDNSVETGPTPNMDEGWGRVDLTQFVLAPTPFQLVDQTLPLSTGQTYEKRVVVSSASAPLRITLAYSDFPGFPGAVPALVNDLDLEVIAPNGFVYRGNQFDQGESVPNAPSGDNINNVEGIYISEPITGEYLVRVRAQNVSRDVRLETPAVDQDFALVISAEIPLPGTGLLFFDRGSYTAPAKMQIKLIDTDLTNQATVSITLKSSFEPSGESLLLRSTGIPGSFTGSMATALGPAASDGRLQVTNNATITAAYFDASINGNRNATARADLLPPLISSVGATNDFGQMVISWSTDEPANSMILFGTNSTLSQGATNLSLVFEHQLELTNLVAGRTYYFAVISIDEAGNVASNNNGGQLFQFTAVPPATMLLVDRYNYDPNSEGQFIPLSTYTDALNQTGVSYDVWPSSKTSPTFNNLRSYRIVMWRINDAYDSPDSLSTQEQATIQQYVNGGGSFFMASMELLSRLGSVPFRTNILHVGRFTSNPNPFEACADCDEDRTVPAIQGVSQDVIGDNVQVDLDYSNYPAIDFLDLGPDFSDTFLPSSDAAPVFYDVNSGVPCGMKFPRPGLDFTGRVVFFSFPLDAIPESAAAPANRGAILRKVIQFLAPGIGGVGTLTLDRASYTVPGFITVEVGDSDLAGKGAASVHFFSTTDPTGGTLSLKETFIPGLFRGGLKLIPVSSPGGAGQLGAANGDQVTLQYFDLSGQATVQASAMVDTQPPAISGVSALAQYEEAVVSWDTSEDSDALVVFGESPLLGRSAFSDALDTYHEVSLAGLGPNRTYFYKVISRDSAGNVVEDDNGGQLYTFRTLPPLLPPFFDNMEGSSTNWAVFNGDDSQANWQLGTPQNLYGVSAHSPQNAWGSNLKGEFIDQADTFLISPAIDLTGGNSAKVHFWHNYDFNPVSESDLLEQGILYVITNAVTEPVVISTYDSATTDWEEVEVNLTPYIGHVIFLVWHYQMLSFDTFPHYGWFIDDVSITITNVVPGTILITNSLAQARFVMTGEMNRSGQGSLLITNAPPGDYVVTFGDVPYYYTPAPKTNSLVPAATIVFQGNYTFDDVNTNGISDAWETHYFGSVSTARTRFTDSDGDGASDYAEFVAGTNPIQPSSNLKAARPARLSDGNYRIDWSSVSGKLYRISGSVDAVHWDPVSNWIQATSTTTTYTLPPPTAGAPYLFKLEVRP
ncbi:MAG: hypothetical protein JWM16_1141, partial [Verrucomicrobiales bacterium]|nr:hypothetical protein [Verrucomicrobiales bacterium]